MSKFLKSFHTLAIVLLIASCSSEEELPQTPVVSSDNNVITIDEAKQDLLSLLADIETADAESRTSSHRTIESSFTTKLGDASSRSDEELLAVHVFNFADDNGFAIMSGDKRVPSLIALAEKRLFPHRHHYRQPRPCHFLRKNG